MDLDINIWLEHYKFFITTIAIIYPVNPTSLTKKKYHDFILNLPIYFTPSKDFSIFFENLMNMYPVSSYLDNKKSFCKWVWFIMNKINIKLEKPTISLDDFYINYYNYYKSSNIKSEEYRNLRKKIVFSVFIILMLLICIFIYKNF